MRRIQKTQVEFESHKLSLRPIGRKCHFTETITWSFQVERDSLIEGQLRPLEKHIDFPVFNKDKKLKTASFILASEKSKYLDDLTEDKNQMNRNYFSADDSENSVMLIAKPGSKSCHCAVCNTSFTDYLNHIYSLGHMKKIKISNFNKDMILLAQKFKRQSEKFQKMRIPAQQQILRNIPQKKHKGSVQTEQILKDSTFNLSSENNLGALSIDKPEVSDSLFKELFSKVYQSGFLSPRSNKNGQNVPQINLDLAILQQ